MFATGDRVVYPLHGGAIIKEIERREQDGAIVEYFILQMLFENMTVSIPVSNATKLGLREIVPVEKLDEVARKQHCWAQPLWVQLQPACILITKLPCRPVFVWKRVIHPEPILLKRRKHTIPCTKQC